MKTYMYLTNTDSNDMYSIQIGMSDAIKANDGSVYSIAEMRSQGWQITKRKSGSRPNWYEENSL